MRNCRPCDWRESSSWLVAVGAVLLAAANGATGQLRMPDQPGVKPPQWEVVHQGPALKLELDRSELRASDYLLTYRVRDGAGRTPVWVAARCAEGLRADLGLTSSAPSTESLRSPELRWQMPAHGSRAELDLVHACDTARRIGLRVDAIPDWRDDEVEALATAWRHTSGTQAFDWRVVYFDSEEAARRGRLERWGHGSRHPAPLRHARSLVDVPPPLRTVLQDLWDPGARSLALSLRGVSGEAEWAVVGLVQRSPVERATDRQEFLRSASAWVGLGLLAAPPTLLTSPSHTAASAYLNARTPEAVMAIQPEHSPNLHYGNGLTPLTAALVSKDLALAQALLARGADPSQCGQLGCPLSLVWLQPDVEQRQWCLELLLRAGARPDAVDPRFRFANTTALGEAALKGDLASAQRLLVAGAQLDGVPGVRATPLEQALTGGHRDMAQWLIDRGASVLPWRDRSIFDASAGALGRGNAWSAVDPQNTELRTWIEGLMLQAAARLPSHNIQLSIEQGGKRQLARDGATLSLQAAPFRLVLRLPGPEPEAAVVAASLAPDFADSARRNQRGNGALSPSRSGALSEVPAADSYDLLIYEAPPANFSVERPWGGHMALQPNPGSRRDFHHQVGDEYSREIRQVTLVPEAGEIPPAVPVMQLKGKSLVLVFGSTLVLDPIDWAPWVKVQTVTLRFR